MYWKCETHDCEIKGDPMWIKYGTETHPRWELDMSEQYCPGSAEMVNNILDSSQEELTAEQGHLIDVIQESCEWGCFNDEGEVI